MGHDDTELSAEHLRIQALFVKVAKDGDDETGTLDMVLEHLFQGARGLLTGSGLVVRVGQESLYFGARLLC